MKFIYAVFALSAIVSSVSATPAPYRKFVKRDVNPNLIPQFGITAGQAPTGTGNCAGIPGPDGQPIQIPCGCPPDRNQFIADLNANVAAGHCINNTEVLVPAFPQDNSTASQLTIFHICTITLQNLVGPGKGCPQSSTTWSAQVQAIQNSANSAPPAAHNAAPSAASASSTPSAASSTPSAASSTPSAASSTPSAASSTPPAASAPSATSTSSCSAAPAPPPSRGPA